MRNDELARDVGEELRRETRVDSRAIAVSAEGGAVTLRGTVGTPWEKREARRAARRVRGVLAVDDQLEVRLLDRHRREDADLRGDILQALVLDARIPNTVDATVKDGVVTLTGTVTHGHELETAEHVAGAVAGIDRVQNHLAVDRSGVLPSAADVAGEIRNALLRNAALDADNIGVTISEGTVRLSGTVHSWEELEAALTAAREAPGVKDVDNQLTVGF